MSSMQCCSECGAELTAARQGGLCTRCLLGLGLKAEVEPGRDSALNLQLPTHLGDYELLEEIARGGMGIVYRARQVSLDRVVAVKLLLAGAFSSPENVQRFRVEASAAASLQHPNIVTIHEVGVCQGQHYLVMDYVDGPSLAKRVAQRPLPPKTAAAYLKIVAEAVHFAHEHGILHRDLKPSNVLLDAKDQPRVADFGLAKRFKGDSEITVSGQLVGSPSYLPPEQASAKRGKVSRRSDVYGLGAMLYHVLTGRAPFQASTITETLEQVLNTEAVAPRLLNPAVPRDLETICLRCLEKEPAKRYPTAQALAEECGRFLNGQPVLARPLGIVGKTGRWCRRNPRLALAVGAAVLSLLLGLAGTTWQWRHAVSERARAEAESLLARRNTYAADMNLVLRALEETDLGKAREILNRYRPAGKSELDLRGWEWRYLWGRCLSDERFTLCQYSNAVTALAFSHDGNWLAVRRNNDAVVLWDAVTRRPVAKLRGSGWYKPLAFSPQGSCLAWAGEESDGAPTVCLRDVAAQKEIARLPHTYDLVSIAFSPDAKELATLDYDGLVRVWNLGAKAISNSFKVATINPWPARVAGAWRETVSSAAMGAVGRQGPESKPIRRRRDQSKIFTDHYGCMVFSPDGRWLAVGEAVPQIRLLERATGKESTLEVAEPADGISALAFSPDSRLLAAGCGAEDNEIHLWDLAQSAGVSDGLHRVDSNGRETRLRGHNGWIMGLAFSPDGQTLASVSTDQTVRLWDVPRRSQQQQFQGHVNEVWALAWSPDGKHLATGGKDGSVRYWDPAAKAAAPYVVVADPICFWGPTFLPDSRSFLAVTRDEGAVTRWDSITGKKLETLLSFGTNHTSVDLSTNGQWLALGDDRGNVQVWDFPGRKLVTNLVARAPRVFALVFSADGAVLNAGALGIDGLPFGTFWSRQGWREIAAPGLDSKVRHVSDAAFSRSGRTFAVGYGNGTAALWDIATGRKLAHFECQYDIGAVVALSDDETLFATASYNGPVTLWDTTGRRLWSIARAHRNALHDLAFSLDGKRLVALGTSPKSPVVVLDVQTGRDVATLPGEPRWYNHIGFSPDGNTLFACSMQGPAQLYHAPSLEEIEAADRGQKTE